ncbi:VirB3 family type IV secretion system protein [Xanthomonas albilineans]|uniref:VirB3 family type IV secretion system protein n=1 Tax=Xanthomonas albilineans TaxID=29447 RepID=UPI0005F32476|nr:VirB3 family type IV secretion system protein [Xanthomonas albilineans]
MSAEPREQFLDDGEPLVAAMARPPMVGGFTLNSLFFALLIPAFLALLLRSVYPLVLIPPALLGAWLVCLRDVYLFEIAQAAMYLKVCPNKNKWGYRSYAPR